MSVLIIGLAFSQNENDLFRFSKTTFQGDARFESMAGSFGGIGANFGCSQINPAGFARYSSSQAGMAFGVTNTKNSSEFNGTTTDTSKTSVKLSNLGIVFVNDISEERGGFLYSQFGFGYNRIENFTYNTSYQGRQNASLLDGFTADGNGIDPQFLQEYRPFSTHLAYESYLIDFDPSTTSYYSQLTLGDLYHERNTTYKGGINEWFVSFSGNYLNKLYVGGNIGIRTFNYKENYKHSETLLDTVGTSLRSFDYLYNLSIKGTGGNIKLGFIYLPTNNTRIGLAFHTPTFVEMEDNWTANMVGYFNDSTTFIHTDLVPSANYKYKVRTPTRLVGSFAYIFDTYGCINVDLEYVNYRSAKFKGVSSSDNQFYSFEDENKAAKEVFKPALNIRVGGELVIATAFFVRGGFAYYPTAFKPEIKAELDNQKIYSAGLGYRQSNFVIDVAYKTTGYKRNFYAFEGSQTTISTLVNTFVVSATLMF